MSPQRGTILAALLTAAGGVVGSAGAAPLPARHAVGGVRAAQPRVCAGRVVRVRCGVSTHRRVMVRTAAARRRRRRVPTPPRTVPTPATLVAIRIITPTTTTQATIAPPAPPTPTPTAPPTPTPTAPPTPTPTAPPTSTPTAPPTSTPTAPPITTPTTSPAPAPAAHIETWAYDDCGNGGGGTPGSLVRAWVSYAESNCGPGGDGKALADCHAGTVTACDVIQYLDTNWIYPSASPTWSPFAQAASESWFQHAPGTGSRVQTSSFGGGYLLNQASPSVQSFFQGYARAQFNADDGLMMDDQSPALGMQLYGSGCGCTTTAEQTSDSGLRTAHAAMGAAMTHSDGRSFLQIDNSLPPNPWLAQGLDLINRSAGVVGLVSEGAPEYDGRLDPYYSTLLDEIAAVAASSNGFVVPLSYGQAGASYQAQSRRVQEGTMLLGYSPGHLADWADLEKGSNNLAIWPEEGIYPTQPLQSMGTPGGGGCLGGNGAVCSTGGHNDLQVAPGVYRREFAVCYSQGSPVGPCAAIVNTTGSAVTIPAAWLSQAYSHQIAFVGGDVQSGGQLDLDGVAFAAGATTVAAQDGMLLTR